MNLEQPDPAANDRASKVPVRGSKEHQGRSIDALSDVLETVNLSGVIFLRAELGDRFGMEMPPPTISHPVIEPLTDEHRLVMFHIVREGKGYLEVEGFEPRLMNEGDPVARRCSAG
jgi:hypothetical protein